MRLIFNTKILKNINFKVLDKEQIIAVLTLSEFIFSNNSTQANVTKKMLLALTGLTESKFNDLIDYGFITFENDTVEWKEQNISWFKNNLDYVNKSKAKKQSVAVDNLTIIPSKEVKVVNFMEATVPAEAKQVKEPKELVDKKTKTRIDWDRLKTMFNTAFKDFEHVAKVQSLDDKRKKAVIKVYEYALTQTDPEDGSKYDFESIYDFCEQYFGLCSQRKGIKTSWVNKGGRDYFKFTWEHFFFNQEKYVNITENNKYN